MAERRDKGCGPRDRESQSKPRDRDRDSRSSPRRSRSRERDRHTSRDRSPSREIGVNVGDRLIAMSNQEGGEKPKNRGEWLEREHKKLLEKQGVESDSEPTEELIAKQVMLPTKEMIENQEFKEPIHNWVAVDEPSDFGNWSRDALKLGDRRGGGDRRRNRSLSPSPGRISPRSQSSRSSDRRVRSRSRSSDRERRPSSSAYDRGVRSRDREKRPSSSAYDRRVRSRSRDRERRPSSSAYDDDRRDRDRRPSFSAYDRK